MFSFTSVGVSVLQRVRREGGPLQNPSALLRKKQTSNCWLLSLPVCGLGCWDGVASHHGCCLVKACTTPHGEGLGVH